MKRKYVCFLFVIVSLASSCLGCSNVQEPSWCFNIEEHWLASSEQEKNKHVFEEITFNSIKVQKCSECGFHKYDCYDSKPTGSVNLFKNQTIADGYSVNGYVRWYPIENIVNTTEIFGGTLKFYSLYSPNIEVFRLYEMNIINDKNYFTTTLQMTGDLFSGHKYLSEAVDWMDAQFVFSFCETLKINGDLTFVFGKWEDKRAKNSPIEDIFYCDIFKGEICIGTFRYYNDCITGDLFPIHWIINFSMSNLIYLEDLK